MRSHKPSRYARNGVRAEKARADKRKASAAPPAQGHQSFGGVYGRMIPGFYWWPDEIPTPPFDESNEPPVEDQVFAGSWRAAGWFVLGALALFAALVALVVVLTLVFA